MPDILEHTKLQIAGGRSATFLTTSLTILFLLTACVAASANDQSVTVTRNLTSIPLAFTENQGQWDEQVHYRANAGSATMWFTTDGVVYQFTRRVARDGTDIDESPDPMLDRLNTELDSIESIAIKANFVGSNPNPRMVDSEEMEYKCNYFIGNDPDKWHTGVSNYQAIVYEDIYDGIDLKYYGNGKQMEYDFIVSPGADPSQIQIRYDGVESVSVNEDGELIVETIWGEVVEQKPMVYQESGLARRDVAGRYVLAGDRTFGFELPDGYDPSKTLVIDPVLEYSTYLGASSWDHGHDIAVDGEGCAYVTGVTWSLDFPLQDPYQDTLLDPEGDGCAVFVTKLNETGSGLVYSTYLGGQRDDIGEGIAVDDLGCAYVTGYAGSHDFPLQNPYQTSDSQGEVFLTKLSSGGDALIYSTYLGGTMMEWAEEVAVDDSGQAYVTGWSESDDFPVHNAYQETFSGGQCDAFVTKFNATGSDLVYSTYLGGSGWDFGEGIDTDSAGYAYITGHTGSNDFPIKQAFQSTFGGGNDAFVVKLWPWGNLWYSTFLGGADDERGMDVAVDKAGDACVTGYTTSADFPVWHALQTYSGGKDAFVAKLYRLGSGMIYATCLGGENEDRGYGIDVDAEGCAYVTGTTASPDFPTHNAFQDTLAGHLSRRVRYQVEQLWTGPQVQYLLGRLV